MSRERQCNAMLNQELTVWLGPREADAIQQDFEDTFGSFLPGGFYSELARCHADAVFQCAPEAEQRRYFGDLASNRRKRVTSQINSASASELPWSSILPPFALSNIQKQRSKYAETYGGSGPLYFDLNQNAGERGDKVSRHLGCFLTRGAEANSPVIS